MEGSQTSVARSAGPAMLLLGIDTCGPAGSVALGRLALRGLQSPADASFTPADLQILGHFDLEGRTYSSTLITAVANLLKDAGLRLSDLAAIVAVNGPGSFTGVRVGLSAVKGLAEPSRLPVAVVSRLQVLAANAGLQSAALDAHRGEVFLRIGTPANTTNPAGTTEMLAGPSELKSINPPPARIAVCDEAAAALLATAWSATELIRSSAPTASDALRLAVPQVVKGAFVDLALLDGHYLRRSDAEIFGEAIEAKLP